MDDRLSIFLKSNNLAIALDVDQVIAAAFEQIIIDQNAKNRTKHTIMELKEYPTSGRPLFSDWTENMENAYDRIWNENWREIKSIADPILLNDLCAKLKVDLVSSRGDRAALPLNLWLNLNYPKLNVKSVIIPKHADKTELPYKLFIDDAPRLAQRVCELGDRMLLLIDAPYNKNIEESKNIIRFNNVNYAMKALILSIDKINKHYNA